MIRQEDRKCEASASSRAIQKQNSWKSTNYTKENFKIKFWQEKEVSNSSYKNHPILETKKISETNKIKLAELKGSSTVTNGQVKDRVKSLQSRDLSSTNKSNNQVNSAVTKRKTFSTARNSSLAETKGDSINSNEHRKICSKFSSFDGKSISKDSETHRETANDKTKSSSTVFKITKVFKPPDTRCNLAKVSPPISKRIPTKPSSERNFQKSLVKKPSNDKNGIGEELEFLQPLQPELTVTEGCELLLQTKIKGARHVVWVKEDKVVANAPPYFQYICDPGLGNFALRIKDVFLQDAGIFVCEAYPANPSGSPKICWCKVVVLQSPMRSKDQVDGVEHEDLEGSSYSGSIDTMDLEDKFPSSESSRTLVIPEIITTTNNKTDVSFTEKMNNSGKFCGQNSNNRSEKHAINGHAVEEPTSLPNQEKKERIKKHDFCPDSDISKNDQSFHNQSSTTQQPISKLKQGTVTDDVVSHDYVLDNGNKTESGITGGTLNCVSQKTYTSSQEDPSKDRLRDIVEDNNLSVSSATCESNDRLKVESQCQLNNNGKHTDQHVNSEPSVKFHPNEVQNLNSEQTKTDKETAVDTFENIEHILKAGEESNRAVPENMEYHENSRSCTTVSNFNSSFSCGTNDVASKISKIKQSNRIVSENNNNWQQLVQDECPTHLNINERKESIGEDSCSGAPMRMLKTHSSTESGDSEILERSTVSSSNYEVGSIGGFRDSLCENPLAPKVVMCTQNFIAILGEAVNIRAKIWTPEDLTSPTSAHWSKLIKGRYEKINENEENYKISWPAPDLIALTLEHATYEHCGKYRLYLENCHGSDFCHTVLSVEGPPEALPCAPSVSPGEGGGSVMISWASSPFDGGSAITGYSLQMKICSRDKSWTTVTPPGFKSLCYQVKGLEEGKGYCFRVCVHNSHGQGPFSPPSDPYFISSTKVGCPSDKKSVRDDKPEAWNEDETVVQGEKGKSDYTEVQLREEEFSEFYEKHEQLGKGRFGIVFKVINKQTKEEYAAKFVKCRKMADKERAQMEFRIMNELGHHPKLICLADAFQMPREFVLVTELISGGELFERVVADDFTLTERECVAFVGQICSGVEFIHSRQVMHLDLKPENILCTHPQSNRIKIIDFGLAHHYNPQQPLRVLFGTAEFVSPEIINYEPISPATDMWAVGVITYILLSGLSPFLGDNDNETFSNITRAHFHFDDDAFRHVSQDAKNFITGIIVKNPTKRLSATECLSHSWLSCPATANAQKNTILPTEKLKRFLLRRKWQKTGNAIRALGRLTTLYSTSRRLSSPASSVSSSSGSIARSFSGETTNDSIFSSLDSTHHPLMENH